MLSPRSRSSSTGRNTRRHFADEFDALSLDLEDGQSKGVWRTNFGYGGVHSRTLTNNGELQVYADRLFSGTGTDEPELDPFRLADGKLEIVAEPLNEDLRQFTWGRSYSSGLLTTKASFSQMYGLFEIRAKLPKGKGLWPAFWLLPENRAWPPELDVLEVLGDNTKKLYVSWHSNVGRKAHGGFKGDRRPRYVRGLPYLFCRLGEGHADVVLRRRTGREQVYTGGLSSADVHADQPRGRRRVARLAGQDNAISSQVHHRLGPGICTKRREVNPAWMC